MTDRTAIAQRRVARAAWLAAGSAFALTAAPAFAQDTAATPTQASPAEAERSPAIEEIVVTAQFRGQKVQDTPIAITAISASTLAAKGQLSITDLGATAPNVNLSSSTGLNGSAVAAFIRGVGQGDSSFALEPGVGIYIDDIYYGTTYGAVMDLTDLDRVEVLRGPQGTLAGKNSLGGAIKLFSAKPNADAGGFVEGTYGRFNRVDLRASANIPITDGVYVRLSGVSKHTDGYMQLLDYGCVNPGSGIAPTTGNNDCRNGTEGGIDVKALRAALRIAPAGSKLEVNLVADVAQNDSEQVATKLVYANNPGVRSYVAGDPAGGVPFDSRFITCAHCYTSYANYTSGGNYTSGLPKVYPFTLFPNLQVAPGGFSTSPKSAVKSWGAVGTIDYALSDALSIKSITGYRSAKGTSGIDLDGSPLAILLQEFGYEHRQFTQELRLSAKFGSLADLTLGGYYYDARDHLTGRAQIPNVAFDFRTDDPVSNVSKSVFGHLELHPIADLTVIGGLRYTNDRKTYTFGRRNPDGSAISPANFPLNILLLGLDGASSTFRGERVDYRIGVNYRWSPELMTYAQVSTGYKGGGINPRPYFASQVQPFNPETLTTYEAGFKSDLLGRALRLNGAVFYNDYKNMQIQLQVCPAFTDPFPCAAIGNAGNAHVKGVELEATLRPVRGLTIDGNVGYLDFQYASVNANTGISRSMKAPFNNKWQASGSVQYQADLGSAGTLTPRLDWTYQSSFYYNAVNTPLDLVAGRSLFNARLTYEDARKAWSASLGVTNLGNKFYYLGTSYNATYGVASGAVGRPREWSLTLRRTF
ncbi:MULTISPECIES: TonB-dependent receptor [unclassified Novosphingobium]|uniref:TonB-dependent receptor n=1 Tax=unclassified Novosphingobium TaxID=2644732 RepID=UPI00146EDFC9|nr:MULTISPECIES: TonB-dependent receptor [unclassified Novosphingobium]NMN04663.1 iron complex outermembrane receptor protein [Novosphingobium sp. SG919]NMN85344.1 iron complex outermembrane receptor protein [Novosphingobium sp. SG916]